MGLASCLMKSYLLLLLFCFLIVSDIKSTKPLKEEIVLIGGKFAALYVIGDSLVDSGNNNHLPTLVRSNFPPYGSNFDGGKATGRFSDGKTIADYVAIYYGLPLAPAYLGLSEEEKNNLSTGINYASAGCGVFPDTGNRTGRCLSMSVQVDLFNKTIENNLKTKFKTQSELNNHLSESLFMTAIGVNDYVYFYNKTKSNPNDFANILLHEFLIQIHRLYILGARKFFINNVKPLGCYPNIIANTIPRGSYDESWNIAIGIFNVKLRESLSYMKHSLFGTSFLYSDYFNFMLELLGTKSLLNTTSPCCPEVYDGGSICGIGSVACEEPGDYVFFDPFHPTQVANFMYAIRCFQERKVCHVVSDTSVE